MENKVLLDFGSISIEAKLFGTRPSNKFYTHLPYEVKLSHWGREYYGPIEIEISEGNPITEIPPGGLAYSKNGNYFCIFLGQDPAWPVEHIGQISEKDWKKLKNKNNLSSVVIKSVD